MRQIKIRVRGGAGHETNLGSERDMLLSRGRGCALVRLRGMSFKGRSRLGEAIDRPQYQLS